MSKFRSKKNLSGFSLIELAITIAIIAILGSLVGSLSSGGNRSKSIVLWQTMLQRGNSLLRLKMDTGCHIKMLSGLYDPHINTAENTFCSFDIPKEQWKGPYLQPFPTHQDTGRSQDQHLSSKLEMEIQRETGGIGLIYFIRAIQVPNEMIKIILQECNGTVNNIQDFSRQKCRGQIDAQAGLGVIDIRFDETL